MYELCLNECQMFHMAPKSITVQSHYQHIPLFREIVGLGCLSLQIFNLHFVELVVFFSHTTQ